MLEFQHAERDYAMWPVKHHLASHVDHPSRLGQPLLVSEFSTKPAEWAWHAFNAYGPRDRGLPAEFSTAPVPPIPVYLNHGAWVVECPDCSAAQLASFEDRRFFCIGCRNTKALGLFRATLWPDQLNPPIDPKDIEALLSPRNIENRNWYPGETLATLKLENEEHDIR